MILTWTGAGLGTLTFWDLDILTFGLEVDWTGWVTGVERQVLRKDWGILTGVGRQICEGFSDAGWMGNSKSKGGDIP